MTFVEFSEPNREKKGSPNRFEPRNKTIQLEDLLLSSNDAAPNQFVRLWQPGGVDLTLYRNIADRTKNGIPLVWFITSTTNSNEIFAGNNFPANSRSGDKVWDFEVLVIEGNEEKWVPLWTNNTNTDTQKSLKKYLKWESNVADSDPLKDQNFDSRHGRLTVKEDVESVKFRVRVGKVTSIIECQLNDTRVGV